MSPAFEIAPPSERTLTAGHYLLGALELAVVLGAIAYAAWSVRRAILPGWTSAPARLAEAVLGLAALLLLSEALGTFGGFGDVGIVAGSVAVAASAHLLARGARPTAARRASR